MKAVYPYSEFGFHSCFHLPSGKGKSKLDKLTDSINEFLKCFL